MIERPIPFGFSINNQQSEINNCCTYDRTGPSATAAREVAAGRKTHPKHLGGAPVCSVGGILPDVSGAAECAGPDFHWCVRRLGRPAADVAARLFRSAGG